MNIEDLVSDFMRHIIHAGPTMTHEKDVKLDANENSNGSVSGAFYNRFPDPLQAKLRQAWADILKIKPENLIIGHGTEQIFDWILKLFIEAHQDTVVYIIPSACGFERRAKIHGALLKQIPWHPDEDIKAETIINALTPEVKMAYLMSPNDPIGRPIPESVICDVAENFGGIIVLNYAYYDFCKLEIDAIRILEYEKTILIQTLDYSWGLAGLQLSALVADSRIISYIESIKNNYNINSITQSLGLQSLRFYNEIADWVSKINTQRERMIKHLRVLPFVAKVYPSEANFVLVKFDDSDKVYRHLLNHDISVADVSFMYGCENCLRITVGNNMEIKKLAEVLELL
ncbi:MAG: aminotransferase class I/II-fold pyridoxal phosphate-dependent enzyme [Bacteroidia bacterium]|nr:aminotransferase class I/II-fold pyridoxal phosphate-dependent enzyme [Bacteroidia bacterium]MDW8334162.1 aminotransferase class I/II-fold pyridoxal phosphate-dependent enzyme [Bacteroidia bacterium]